MAIVAGDCLLRRGMDQWEDKDEPWVVKVEGETVHFVTPDDDSIVRTMTMKEAEENFVVVEHIEDDLDRYQ